MINKRFSVKLTFIIIAFIGISVLGAGLISANQLQRSHLESVRDSMIHQLEIISVSVPWIEGTAEEKVDYFTGWATRIKLHPEMRVTFMSLDGTVVGDSDYDARGMDNHLARPEFAEAKKTGHAGFSDRLSETVHSGMIYAAVQIHNDQGEAIGYVRLASSLTQVKAQIIRLWMYLIAGLLGLFAAAGLVGYRVAKSVSRPLGKMMTVAQQIAHSNYSARVEVQSYHDEFGELGKAINQMAVSLQQQMVQISDKEHRLKNVLDHMITGILLVDEERRFGLVNPAAEQILGLHSDALLGHKIDELTQQADWLDLLNQALINEESIRDELILYYPRERHVEMYVIPLYSNEIGHAGSLIVLHDITEIRRLERMRSEFVANVSHELKTPIAAVKGFSETLLAGAMNDQETARSFLQIILDESGRLDRLIADILHLSKIESKLIPLQFSPVELKELISQTVEMVQPEADQKRIQINLHIQDELYLEADEDRLRQILLNLVSNAIHYTGEGGSVSIDAELIIEHTNVDEERIRIRVSDTGMGIPKKDLPRIFERFYRVDKARSRSSGGTGLGLSIVKHLIDLHHGKIDVQSELGFGTVFSIELPVLQHEL